MGYGKLTCGKLGARKVLREKTASILRLEAGVLVRPP